MQPHVRYQILETIAQGDFATVHRARDNELGREVAIKQIHQQYLTDPAKLERYWQEAQLLATLEHPYIMTIYDIVRQRGWLILELMQGSLKQKLAGQPIDLEDLRLTLTYVLHALQFLHENGIIHGDVKPGNLLLDKAHRVKLGDFGIARRLTQDEGSVIKGTTKYMAPEVVSDQFGPVGPHSDLYSLGFSAFELMCGSHFDTLFPGLNMFGRDQQIAWMMWHSAADRRLPEIHRVLAGVPDDLAHVIQKLTEKDPARRYRSAEEALADLRGGGPPAAAEPVAEEQSSTRRRRLLAIGALAVSVCLSAAILLVDQVFPTAAPKAKVQQPLEPAGGMITNIFADRNLLEIDPGGGQQRLGVQINPEQDRILLDDRKVTLQELKKGDRITITRLKTLEGRPFKEIVATRPPALTTRSVVETVDANTGTLVLAAGGDDQQPLELYVPSDTPITINGASTIRGRPVRLADLRRGDRIRADHVESQRGRVALALEALRTLKLTGVIHSLDANQKTITIGPSLQAGGPGRKLAVAAGCRITLNGADVLADGNVVTLADLKRGDQVSIEHDAEVTRIEAQRRFTASGPLAAIDVKQGRMLVRLPDQAAPVPFTLAPDCQVQLVDGTLIPLWQLRAGDQVTVVHESADLRQAEARSVTALLQPDPARWAVVVGIQQYDDKRLTPLAHAAADAAAVRDTLVRFYRIPPDQLLFEQDPTRPRLEQALPAFLQRLQQAGQLIVYVAGHAYLDDAGRAVLATKAFELKRISQTGLPLQWLLDQLEAASAREKLLLLDTCHEGSGEDLKRQPSSAELVETLRPAPHRPISASVTVIASCTKGQRGRALPDGRRGVFADCVATALAGEADDNRDHVVDAAELYKFLAGTMPRISSQPNRRQTPARFLPDATPPRLMRQTQQAVRRLLQYLDATRIVGNLQVQYRLAQARQPDQPDVALAFALVSLKHNRTKDAQDVFEKVRREHPEAWLPYHALAWQYFMQKRYEDGIEDLRQFVMQLAKTDDQQEIDPYIEHVLHLAGQLREFALRAADPPLTLEQVHALDQAVLSRGERVKQIFAGGVQNIRERVAELDRKIRETADQQEKEDLRRDRKRLTYYAHFDFAAAAEHLRSRLNQ